MQADGKPEGFINTIREVKRNKRTLRGQKYETERNSRGDYNYSDLE